MSISEPQVLPVQLPSVDERTALALHQHFSSIQAERFPSEPTPTLAARRERWRSRSGAEQSRSWVVWAADGEAIVASAGAGAAISDANARAVMFDVLVQPGQRRQGLGTRLLAAIADFAEVQGRAVLLTQTQRQLPGGAIWMARLGAAPSLESQSLQLDLAAVERPLVQSWIARGRALAEFELGFWTGPYPEADLAAMAQLHEVHSEAPSVSSAMVARITPETLRQQERALWDRSEQRWTAYVRERATGRLVGFTELIWSALDPATLEQGVTGVLPEVRQRGLGRWLKAALLDKISGSQPAARAIRSGNATSNTAMLSLNHALGFQTISADTWWELELDQVRRYLAASAVPRA